MQPFSARLEDTAIMRLVDVYNHLRDAVVVWNSREGTCTLLEPSGEVTLIEAVSDNIQPLPPQRYYLEQLRIERVRATVSPDSFPQHKTAHIAKKVIISSSSMSDRLC